MKHSMKVILCVLCALCALFAISCQSSDEDAPRGYVGMQDENGDYTLYVPSFWTQDESHGMQLAYAAQDPSVSVSVTAVSMSQKTNSEEEYWKSYREEFEKTFSDFSLEEDGYAATMGGLDAKKFVFSGTVAGTSYRFMQVLTQRNAVIYTFTFTAPADLYDSYSEQAGAILANFKFR